MAQASAACSYRTSPAAASKLVYLFPHLQGHAKGTCTVWALAMGVREDAPFELNRVAATAFPVNLVASRHSAVSPMKALFDKQTTAATTAATDM